MMSFGSRVVASLPSGYHPFTLSIFRPLLHTITVTHRPFPLPIVPDRFLMLLFDSFLSLLTVIMSNVNGEKR